MTEGTESRAWAWIVVPSFLYVAAHVVAIAEPAALWGFDGLFYRPAWTVVGGCGAVAAVWLVRQRGLAAFRPDLVTVIAGCAMLLGLSLVYPSATPLLGDGLLHIRELDNGVWDSHPRMNRAPLTFWLLHQIQSVFGSSAAETYAWLSRLSGLCFVVLSAMCSRTFGTSEREGGFLFLLLLTQGYILLFLGYPENCSILFPLMAAYLLLCERARQGTMPVYVPAAVLGLLVPLHFVTLAAAPALIWAAIRRGAPHIQSRIISLLGMTAAPAVTTILTAIIGVDPRTLLHAEPGGHILPVSGELLALQPYHLFTFEHAADILNQYGLVAPAFAVGLLVSVRSFDRHSDADVLLAAAGLPLLAFTFLFNPAIGAFRDWDAFSLPALPLTILTARCFVRWAGTRLVPFALIVLGVSATHTFSWIGVSASTEASTERFDRLVSEASLSPVARACGAATFGAMHRDNGDLEKALEAFTRASEYDPGNGRYHVGRAYVLNLLGQKKEAESALTRALMITPDRLEAMINLGKLYADTGQLSKALSMLRRALRKNPESQSALHTFGLVAYRMREYERAVFVFRRAVELDPDELKYQIDLGTALKAAGQLSEAESVLRDVIRKDPSATAARMNLGTIAFQRGSYEEAAAAFRSTVELDPGYSGAHLNLALALIQLQDTVGARDHLMKVVALGSDSLDVGDANRLLESIGSRP